MTLASIRVRRSASKLRESRPPGITPLSGFKVTGKTLLKAASNVPDSGAYQGSPVPPGNQGFGSLSCLWAKFGCFEVIDNKVVQSGKLVFSERLLPILCIRKSKNELIGVQPEDP